MCRSLIYYKETPTQVFSCEYCEMFKNTCFKEQLRMAAPASHPKVPPLGTIIESHHRVPPQGLTLGSHLRVPPGLHLRVLGPTSPLCRHFAQVFKQKQAPELFYKKRCSWKFRKIRKKTFVLEPLF